MTNGRETLPPPKVDPRIDGYEGPARSFEKLVDSRMFITFARIMMIAATLIGLPVAGALIKRAIDTADTTVTKVDELITGSKLLQLEVKNGFDRSTENVKRLEADIQDHETRIRVLERIPPAITLMPGQPQRVPTRPN